MANEVIYGFEGLQSVFDKRVNEVGVREVIDAIEQSVAEHNRQMDALIALFAEPTTDFKVRFQSPTVARLQPLDEHGRARPLQVAGHYEVAFPIQKAGAALGVTYEAMVKMTVQEANRRTAAMLEADMRWVRDHILAALYTNSAWTFADDEHGNLTIQPLANNDGTIYYVPTGGDAGIQDNHYLAQANSISDAANPFPTIYDELVEHPENGDEVIVFAPTNLRSSIEGLSGFHEIQDPNITPGIASDRLTATLGVPVPGQVIGYVDRCWIAEWRSLPDNYLIAVTTGGAKPLRMRQHPEPELQGFRRDEGQREDYPYFESQWVRRAGFGAWNRVGALVYRIGNASYAIPTGYSSPMP